MTRLTKVWRMSTGIAEDDDVAALDRPVRQQVLGDRSGRRIGELVDQQVVADEQRVLHGPGGDDEGLHQRGGAEQEQEDGDRPLGDKSPLRVLPERRRRGGVLLFRNGYIVWVH